MSCCWFSMWNNTLLNICNCDVCRCVRWNRHLLALLSQQLVQPHMARCRLCALTDAPSPVLFCSACSLHLPPLHAGLYLPERSNHSSTSDLRRNLQVASSPFYILGISGTPYPADDYKSKSHEGSVYRVLGIPPAADADFEFERSSHVLTWPRAQQVCHLNTINPLLSCNKPSA